MYYPYKYDDNNTSSCEFEPDRVERNKQDLAMISSSVGFIVFVLLFALYLNFML